MPFLFFLFAIFLFFSRTHMCVYGNPLCALGWHVVVGSFESEWDFPLSLPRQFDVQFSHHPLSLLSRLRLSPPILPHITRGKMRRHFCIPFSQVNNEGKCMFFRKCLTFPIKKEHGIFFLAPLFLICSFPPFSIQVLTRFISNLKPLLWYRLPKRTN